MHQSSLSLEIAIYLVQGIIDYTGTETGQGIIDYTGKETGQGIIDYTRTETGQGIIDYQERKLVKEL